jgi:hypothetical protein
MKQLPRITIEMLKEKILDHIKQGRIIGINFSNSQSVITDEFSLNELFEEIGSVLTNYDINQFYIQLIQFETIT